MSEILSLIIGVIAILIIELFKPEWFIGWLLKLLNKKLPNKSNKIENALGYKLIETGIYTLNYNIDDEKLQQAIAKLGADLILVKEAMKDFLE